MLDIRFICENADKVKEALSWRSGKFDVDAAVELDKKRREIIRETESRKATRNSVSQQISLLKQQKNDASLMIAQMKELGEEIKALDEELRQVEAALEETLLTIPNVPHDSVPRGKSEEDNVEVRRFGEIKEFDFSQMPHWEIGEKLGILDFAAAAKLSGARFTVYNDKGARQRRL